MTRVDPVEADEADPETAALLQRLASGRGTPPALWTALANQPELLRAHAGLYEATADGEHLGPELEALVGVAVAGVNGCAACLANHREVLVGAPDVDTGVVDAVARGHLKPLEARERQAVAFARRVARDPGSLMETEFDGLRAVGFDDSGIVELLGVVVRALAENAYVEALSIDTDPDED